MVKHDDVTDDDDDDNDGDNDDDNDDNDSDGDDDNERWQPLRRWTFLIAACIFRVSKRIILVTAA